MMQRQEYKSKVVFYDTLKKVFVARKKKYENPFKVFHASFSLLLLLEFVNSLTNISCIKLHTKQMNCTPENAIYR